jgi:hypothetical protein
MLHDRGQTLFDCPTTAGHVEANNGGMWGVHVCCAKQKQQHTSQGCCHALQSTSHADRVSVNWGRVACNSMRWLLHLLHLSNLYYVFILWLIGAGSTSLALHCSRVIQQAVVLLQPIILCCPMHGLVHVCCSRMFVHTYISSVWGLMCYSFVYLCILERVAALALDGIPGLCTSLLEVYPVAKCILWRVCDVVGIQPLVVAV